VCVYVCVCVCVCVGEGGGGSHAPVTMLCSKILLQPATLRERERHVMHADILENFKAFTHT
jgi:hypothetical protein